MKRSTNRWAECDQMSDPIARLDCRTSRLNDATHLIQHDLHRLNAKVSAGLLMQCLAGLGGIAALLTAIHNLGII